MSLTSYRAAPPRVMVCEPFAAQTRTRRSVRGAACCVFRSGKEAFVLGRPGNDLLSRVLRHSTIGAEEFNGRVRDGIGFFSPRSNHRTGEGQRQGRQGRRPERFRSSPKVFLSSSRTGTMRAIKPIERLVPVSSTRRRAYTPGLSTWSSSTALIGSTRFKVGFPLRCLQRLSRPYIATLHCGWRHNSSTRGTSIPVLSY